MPLPTRNEPQPEPPDVRCPGCGLQAIWQPRETITTLVPASEPRPTRHEPSQAISAALRPQNTLPEDIRETAREAFAGRPRNADGALSLPVTRNPWLALDDALAATVPAVQAAALRATADDWEALGPPDVPSPIAAWLRRRATELETR
ncbi:hypothetical protein ACFHW2_12095 [Actinomadura sp. LOL_016]|uniref:hypothetical protein n=1 Tax=unclassified Actinomadura TaxID=2626254 RepID=UPI003A8024EC